MSRWGVRIGLALVALFALAACALAGPQGHAGPYTVEIVTDPAVVPVGRAELRLTITDRAGKPVTGASVRTLTQMATMSMGETETPARPGGEPGQYVSDAVFAMAGTYDARVTVSGPQGQAQVTIPLTTGTDTVGSGGGLAAGAVLPWLIVLGAGAVTVYRMRKTGQRVHWKGLLSPQAVSGLLLLAAMYGGIVYAVNHWRRPGAMTPIEAQAMEMNTPPPAGVAAVRLATAQRGTVEESVRYTGQVVAYTEEDIIPRVQGWITSLPVYAGDRVTRGQIVARLDTSQIEPQVAERQAAVNMAQQGADISRAEYRQMLAELDRDRAESGGKREAVSAAEADREAAREEFRGAQADRGASETEIADAEAGVSGATAEQTYQQAELARVRALYAKGAVSTSELQQQTSSAATADAGVRAAQAKLAGARSRVTAAEAAVRKAAAMAAAADRRVAQTASDAKAADTAVTAAAAAADTARRKIGESEAGVQQAAAGLAGATTAEGYSEIRTLVGGMVTERVISPGVLVNPGQTILKVAQITPIRLQVNVPEEDLERIHIGSAVWVHGPGDSDRPLAARVTSVTPAVDPVARTGIVEAVVPNTDRRFLPGQFVSMEIVLGRISGLRIPEAAVHRHAVPGSGVETTRTQPWVWVAETSGDRSTVRRTDVETGLRGAGFVEIRSGLSPGMQVVTEGADNLHDGDAVTSAESAATVGQGPTVKVTSAGFEPGMLQLKAGVPQKITFVRTTDDTCVKTVVFDDYGIKEPLPLNRPVVVAITPRGGRDIVFSCAMHMVSGKVQVMP